MRRTVRNRLRIAALLAAAALPFAPVHAQQGALVFKNFHAYPPGQWLKEMTAIRNNVAIGPPRSETSCASPLDARGASAAVKLGNASAPQCTMKVLEDEERSLEYEQTCAMGATPQVIRVTVRAVDDKTMTMDTRMSMAGVPDTVTKTKATYQGACRPADTAAGTPQLPSTPPADCAEVAHLRHTIEAGAAQCAQMPAPDRAQCEQRLVMGRKALAMQEQQCR